MHTTMEAFGCSVSVDLLVPLVNVRLGDRTQRLGRETAEYSRGALMLRIT